MGEVVQIGDTKGIIRKRGNSETVYLTIELYELPMLKCEWILTDL